MLILPLALALALTAPAGASPCSGLAITSTLVEQFTCYKDAGRKVVLPGTDFIDGFNGPGCIVGVGADRIQVAKCSSSSFDRVTLMVPFASIRAVEDDPSKAYVTIRMAVTVIQADCRTIDCGAPTYVPVHVHPAPQPTPRLIATPRRP